MVQFLSEHSALIAILTIIIPIAIFLWNKKIVNDNAKRDAARNYVQRYQDQHNLKKYDKDSHDKLLTFFREVAREWVAGRVDKQMISDEMSGNVALSCMAIEEFCKENRLDVNLLNKELLQMRDEMIKDYKPFWIRR